MTLDASRRAFLASLAAGLAAGTRALAQAPALGMRFLSHSIIAVSDLQKSVALYQQLLGPAVVHDNAAIFRFGESGRFLGLTQAAAGAAPGYVSYGIAIDGFDPEATKRALSARGVTSEIVNRGDTPELWVTDPSGIKLQLQHPSYLRGVGTLGANLPAAAKAGKPPVFAARTYSHVTIQPKDGPANITFYQGTLGMKVQAMQGPAAAMLAVGPGPDFVAVPTRAFEGAKNAIDHVCLTVQNFDPQKLMGGLIGLGFEPLEATPTKPMACGIRFRQRASNGGGPSSPMGTPELYLHDADNIRVQVADVKYCGGSGWLGEICP